ncbi:hypothetical protein ACWOFR_08645 [Carnobacterium gallinarum]|uniref:hypothetical protein n=1 Tax=Carnobacterium gallinarum TaxID=2749 RepID=UPI00055945A8|nr:hypothetical protein [Carnobacterium gallinarum]
MSNGRRMYQKINSLAGYMIVVQIFATMAILVGGFYLNSQTYQTVNMTEFVVKNLVQCGLSVFILTREMAEPSVGKAFFILIIACSIGWMRYNVMFATGFFVSYGFSGIALVIMAVVLLFFQFNYEQYRDK